MKSPSFNMDLESEKQFNQTPIENFETADNSN